MVAVLQSLSLPSTAASSSPFRMALRAVLFQHGVHGGFARSYARESGGHSQPKEERFHGVGDQRD